jgi:hypothetical protein
MKDNQLTSLPLGKSSVYLDGKSYVSLIALHGVFLLSPPADKNEFPKTELRKIKELENFFLQ